MVATCKLNEEDKVKVKDGIENELIVVKDKKGNEEIVQKQLRKLNLFVALKVFAQKNDWM